jgi:hypothetical protein
MLNQTNWLGVMPTLLRQNWYAWVPTEHFWHFTPHGISKIVEHLGWNVLEVEYSSLVHTCSDVSVNPLSQRAAKLPGLGDQFVMMLQMR